MQSSPVETSFAVKKESSNFAVEKEENGLTNAASAHGVRDLNHEPPVVLSDEDGVPGSVVKDGEFCDASKQLVIYDPKENGSHESEPVPDPVSDNQTCIVSNEMVPYDPKAATHKNLTPRVSPSVGAFTVQCDICFKWRLIPTKAKYEEIREHILDHPFVCDMAREWQPEISCDDPPDIQPDGSRLWAIDKPSIAQPPPGWERELRIRGEGSSKFADVYYIAPSGKKLRSMVEIQKYLLEHHEHLQGVQLSRFSFQIPKPLQENYVRKRPRAFTSSNNSNLIPSRALELDEVAPYSAETPDTNPVKQQKTTDSSPAHSNEGLHKIKI